jgi:hypothetical protein
MSSTVSLSSPRRHHGDPEGGRRTLLDGVLVGLVAATAGLFALRAPTFTEDEYSLLIYADLIARGRIPNRDFFTPYGPGTLWPVTLANQIAGHPSVTAERIVGLGYHVALAVGVWRLASRYGRRSSLVAGCLSGLIAATLSLTAYGWLAALAAAVWFIVLASSGKWFWAGVLAILAVTVRPEFMLVIAACSAVLLTRRRDLILLLSGIGLGGLPLWFHLVVAGPSLLRNVFLDRVAVNGRVAFPSPASWLGIAFVLLCLCLAILLLVFATAPARVSAVHAMVGLLVFPQALQRTDSDHIAFVAVLLVPLAAAALLGSLSFPSFASGINRTVDATFYAGVISIVCLCAVVATFAPRGDSLVIRGRQIFTFGPSASSAVERVVKEVEAKVPRGETFFVGASDMSRFAVTSNYLYFLMPDRVPDAYYLELAPGVSERQGSRLIDDVRDARFLVLTRVDPDRELALYPYLPRGSEIVNRYVDRHFCHSGAAGEVDIYSRCPGPPSGGIER